MQLNTLILAKPGAASLNSYSIELDYRLDGLLALYKMHMNDAAADRFHYQSLAMDFIGRGGQIHYTIDQDGRVLGSAYVLTSNSLIQNLYPVERFFVENQAVDHKTQAAVADCLLASIVKTAEAEMTRHLPIWIQLTFPEGALGHPESQPIYGALEANHFRGIGAPGAELWIRIIEEPAPLEA